MDADYYYPPQIIEEILLRLPSKSICRFRSVSKSWRSLFSTKSFIASHLNQNKNKDINTHLLLTIINPYQNNEERFLFHRYDVRGPTEPITNSFVPMFPNLLHGNTRILGICDGLICLMIRDFNRNNNDATIVIWNPSIRRAVVLPKSSVNANVSFPNDLAVMGFGADLVTKDYKVVRIVYCNKGVISVVGEVFSLSTRVWRRIEVVGLDCFLPPPSGIHAYVNNRAHWIGWKREGQSRSLIMSFDMHDEVFQELPLPGDLAGKLSFDLELSVSRGCLAVIENVPSQQRYLSLWVMKEYGVSESWTLMFTFDEVDLIRPVAIRTFSKTGDILIRMSENRWARYDPEKKRIMYLHISHLGAVILADKYEESLVLLNYEGLDRHHPSGVQFIHLGKLVVNSADA